MSQFDLRRLRHNFDQLNAPPEPAPQARFLRLEAPLDPYPEARRLLDSIGLAIERDFVDQRRGLHLFLNEARALLERLAPTDAPLDAPSLSPKEASSVRAELSRVLADIEDLLEVSAGIGRR
jgi:hypothetical protein